MLLYKLLLGVLTYNEKVDEQSEDTANEQQHQRPLEDVPPVLETRPQVIDTRRINGVSTIGRPPGTETAGRRTPVGTRPFRVVVVLMHSLRHPVQNIGAICTLLGISTDAATAAG